MHETENKLFKIRWKTVEMLPIKINFHYKN